MRLFVLGLLACNQTEGFKIHNSDPVADIYSHETPLQVEEGTVVRFTAALSDDNDATDTLIASWMRINSDNQSLDMCAPEAPDENGDSTCEIEIFEDTLQVKVLVRDPQNSIGYDIVNIEAIPTSPPVVQIVEPMPSTVYYVDLPVPFHALVEDNEDQGDEISLYWESDVDQDLGIAGNALADGSFADSALLTQGEHQITVTATDSHGKTADDTVRITVGPPNTPPNCQILTPVDGSYSGLGDSVVFVGSVSDVDVPSNLLLTDWSSSIDGVLAANLTPSGGSTTVITESLSLGEHQISLHVVDEVGGECTATIAYTVETPSVHIVLPNDGERFNEGEPVAFEGSIVDPNGPENVAVTWTSDVDGMINSDAPSTSGALYFSLSSLSIGAHVLTLEGVNPNGLSNQDSISFSINGRPETPTLVISPDPASPGEPLVVTATSSDPEDGTNLDYTYEWYDDEGNLVFSETTQSSTSTLPETTQYDETWTVKVTVSDQEGHSSEEAEASITLAPANTPPDCEIVTPADNSYGALGASAVFIGSVSDPDASSNSLLTDWSSDIDGMLAENLIPSAGLTTLVTDSLSLGAHEITLHVVDEAGAECTTAIVFTVETPSIRIVLPNDGDRFNEGDSISFEGSIVDPSGPENVAVTWTSDVDGMINNASSSTSGALYFSLSSLSVGMHALTLEGVNPDGLSNQDSISFSINGRPETPTITLSPDPASSGDPLVATVTSEDPEDGTDLDYSYEWYDDEGNLVFSETTDSNTSTLPETTESGQIWTVRVTVSDQEGFSSEQAESSISVVDCDPSATEIPYDGIDSNCDGLEFLNDQDEDGIPDDPNENFDADHSVADGVDTRLGVECYGVQHTHTDESSYYLLYCDTDYYWKGSQEFCVESGYDGLATAKDDEEYQNLIESLDQHRSYSSPTSPARGNVFVGLTRGPDCSPVSDTNTGFLSECGRDVRDYYWIDGSDTSYIEADIGAYWDDGEMVYLDPASGDYTMHNSSEHCAHLKVPTVGYPSYGYWDLYCDATSGQGSHDGWSENHTNNAVCIRRDPE